MSAFSRLFALALFFIALVLAENTIVAHPLAGRWNDASYSGSAGVVKGGSVENDTSNSCTGVFCRLFGVKELAAVGSHNGGNAGESESGDADNSGLGTKSCMHKRANTPPMNAYSGSGQDASGGTASNSNSVFDIGSDNAGNGGESKSGNSENC